MQHVLDLRERVDALENTVLRMDNQFRQLRGYVYAKKGLVGEGAPPGPPPAAPSTEVSPPQKETREQLRARLVREGRFIPGKPPVHSE
jgi:hypothetical protein